MTREERKDAIANLNVIRVALIDAVTAEQGKLVDDTFRTAIEALEQFETVTEFADRCRECGARYGKLLKQKSCEGITPATPKYQKVYMQGWNDGRNDLIEKIKREFKI